MKTVLSFTLNGDPHELLVDTRRTLLEVVRDQIGLTGTHQGCNTGNCGACTLLVNGQPVTSCLLLAAECEGSEVLTVEGLQHAGALHPLQQAMVQHGAIQCGFCTPGVVMSAYALLAENPQPSELQVREALAGNLCRCTGYVKIVEAVLSMQAQDA